MPFTFEEKCFIKILRQEKGWGAKRICSEFRQKKWAVIVRLTIVYGKSIKLVQLSEKSALCSGRPSSIGTQRNISRVNDLICSQQSFWYQQKSSLKLRKVTGISCSSVRRIAMRDLRLNVSSAHLPGESWPTDHQQVHWSVAWQTKGSSSSEWWTYWTVVLNIWFICMSCSVV